jgi:hypothetical protein
MEYSLLGCNEILLGECPPFQRKVSPLCLGLQSKPCEKAIDAGNTSAEIFFSF